MKKALFLFSLLVMVFASCDLFNFSSSPDDNDDPIVSNDSIPPGVVTEITVDEGNLRAKLTWIDPPDTDLNRIEITVDPVIRNLSQPVIINPGIQEVYIVWPEWTGEEYIISFKAVDDSGNSSSTVTIPIRPDAPVIELAPDYLKELIAFPIDADTPNITWGGGFNSILGQPLTGSPLVINPETDVAKTPGSSEVITEISMIQSSQAMESFIQETTEVGVSAGGAWGPVSGSVSVNVSDSRSLNTEISSTDLNFIIYQRCRSLAYILNSDNIEFDYTDMIRSPSDFYSLYGDRYLYSVQCGYDIYVLLKIKNTSEDTKETIVESLGLGAEVGAYGFTASVSFNQSNAESIANTAETTNIELTSHIFGWAGSSIAETTIDGLKAQLDAFQAAYFTAAANSPSSIWQAGTVEVQYRNYYDLLDENYPTYPNIDLENSTFNYRQLVLDQAKAQVTLDKLYSQYGPPEVWSQYAEDDQIIIQNLEDNILNDLTSLTASLEEARSIDNADDFDSFVPYEPVLDFDIINMPAVAITAGDPPDGFTAIIPSWDFSPYVKDKLSGYYNPVTMEFAIESKDGSSGTFIFTLPDGFTSDYTTQYYVYWTDVDRSGGSLMIDAGDNSLVIYEAQQLPSGSATLGGGVYDSHVKIIGSNFKGKLYFYRKRTSSVIVLPF